MRSTIAAWVVVAVSCAHAQSVTSATVSGHLEDTSGASVTAALIELRNIGRNQKWVTASDAEGRYRFVYLPPGDYALCITDPRFTHGTKLFDLQVGQVLDVPIVLQLAGVRE